MLADLKRYASGYYSLAELGDVKAEYEGIKVKGKVNLVVSHGCQPFETQGAWCSPGYWGNAARDAAWDLIGYSKSDLFNDTVVPSFYDTPSAANPTLRRRSTQVALEARTSTALLVARSG